jgi:hypothetical protein
MMRTSGSATVFLAALLGGDLKMSKRLWMLAVLVVSVSRRWASLATAPTRSIALLQPVVLPFKGTFRMPFAMDSHAG